MIGWWKLSIEAQVNGINIDFEKALPLEVKRRIMKMVADGCVAGEIEDIGEIVSLKKTSDTADFLRKNY